jgi:hypothetical protein
VGGRNRILAGVDERLRFCCGEAVGGQFAEGRTSVFKHMLCVGSRLLSAGHPSSHAVSRCWCRENCVGRCVCGADCCVGVLRTRSIVDRVRVYISVDNL